jgi:ABC-type dipeptide/oligopeptide/nickel transport system permease subunit
MLIRHHSQHRSSIDAGHKPTTDARGTHPFFDMTHTASANVFTGLTGAVIAFQLALVVGAPWGALTQGGRFNGVLPAGARVFALCSAALLALFIVLVRARAHPNARFRRAVWGVVAYCAVGILANAATPSPAERALWLPVVAVMFLTSLHVARRPDSRSPKTVAPTGAA